VIVLARQDLSGEQIAQRLGVNRAAIYAKCKAAGLSFRDLRGSGDAAAKGGRADG
jgi:biotin operon repressor